MDRAHLKLQAYLDGELPECECREITEQLNRDADSAALMQELRQTRDCLCAAETDKALSVPETREFYWSKIQREIQRQTKESPARGAVPLMDKLRRWLIPATGLALAGLVCLLVIPGSPSSNPATALETAVADSGAFTYHDFSAGTTLVWISYPADNEVAKPGAPNTLQ